MEAASRQTYLDWLRIISVSGVLFFHSAMPYVAEDQWHIKNSETSYLMLESNIFLHLFRMPLLFFISGTVSYYMMQRRSTLSFIGLRFRRLFIPLVVGMFIIVPPQIYMERINQGFKGNYWDFYHLVFQFVPYPKGNFSWHHLWFIAYLLVYDILLAPLFAWLVSVKSHGFRQFLAVMAKGKWVYLPALLPIIWYALFTSQYPETNDLIHDYCYFIYWLTFLLAGFICITQPLLLDSLERNRTFAITIGFTALLFYDYLRWNKIEPGHLNWHLESEFWSYAFVALRPVIAWGWVLGLVGYGKKYLNRKHKVLGYLNQAVYPFYILHQSVMVVLVYYIVKTPNESIFSKYIYTVALTLFVTMGIYHLFIRPYALTRLFFGMKPLNKTQETTSSTANVGPVIKYNEGVVTNNLL
jgi:glucan biosynthesis protein C